MANKYFHDTDLDRFYRNRHQQKQPSKIFNFVKLFATSFALLKILMEVTFQALVIDKLYAILFRYLKNKYPDSAFFTKPSEVTEMKKNVFGKYLYIRKDSNCRFFDIYHYVYMGIFDIMILAFILFKNRQLWKTMLFSITFNARLQICLLQIFGCLGFTISAILNAFPDLDGLSTLMCVITFLFTVSNGNIKRFILLSLCVSVVSLLISLIAAPDQFASAISESLELFKNYYNPFFVMYVKNWKN